MWPVRLRVGPALSIWGFHFAFFQLDFQAVNKIAERDAQRPAEGAQFDDIQSALSGLAAADERLMMGQTSRDLALSQMSGLSQLAQDLQKDLVLLGKNGLLDGFSLRGRIERPGLDTKTVSSYPVDTVFVSS